MEGRSVRIVLELDTTSLPKTVDVDDAIESAQAIIESRLEEYGAEAEVERQGQRIEVTARRIDSADEAAKLIGSTGLLEFREPIFADDGNILCRSDDGNEFAVARHQIAASTGGAEKRLQCIGTDQRIGEVQWKPATGTVNDEISVLTGQYLRATSEALDNPANCNGNSPCMAIEFTDEGGRLFEQITTRLVGNPIGIFVDDDLISAPNVAGPISGGAVVITGLTLEEAKRIAAQLNAGTLPVPLKIISTEEFP